MKLYISFDCSSLWIVVLQCLGLALLYVGSLYLFKSPYLRDDPFTIRQRMKCVLVVCLIAPIYVMSCGSSRTQTHSFHLFEWLGMHAVNILPAFVLPLILTVILFIGPIAQIVADEEEFQNLVSYVSSGSYLTEIRWYRNYVVAPFTEEFVFRACMLPIFMSCFGLTLSVFVTPLFFGVAHLHHAIERIALGVDLKQVLFTSLFQFCYTSLFGAYGAFIFLRTGHLIGPVISHCFCNIMGFPDFLGVLDSKYPKAVGTLYVFGLVCFLYLLFPLSDPAYFGSLYWV